jgi:putative thioredoxin
MISRVFRHVSHQEIQKVAFSAMEEYKNFIFEVDSIQVWLSKVLKSPSPVILQAYANWSLPCRKIVRVLEQKAMLDEGKWNYARMDIDEMNELASALSIFKVPTLFLINKGNVFSKVEGIITEENINEIVEDAKLVAGLVSDENVFQGLLMAGEEFVKDKKFLEAIKSFEEAKGYKEFSEKYQARIVKGLLQAYFLMGDLEKTKEILENAKNQGFFDQEIIEIEEKVLKKFEKDQENQGKIDELKRDVSQDPDNFELLSKLALAYHSAGLNEQAIEISLGIIEKEKSFKGFGQKTVLQIINDLGNDHLLTKPTRKKMQSLYIKFS